MWGEFETPPKLPSVCESADTNRAPVCRPREQQVLPALGFERNKSNVTNTEEPRQDNDQPRVVSSCVRAMVEAVALSRTQVKSQQIGDAELSLDQRTEELLQQYRSRPLVFLERYQAFLKPQHLAAFAQLSCDPRAQHYCRVIQRRSTGHTDRTRVRNQRYAALRALQREGQYFSEEQMRVREPLLYEQYIGQYLSDDELLERSLEAMQGGAHGGADGPGGGTGGLAHILLDSYQERLIQNRLQEEQEREEGAQEEDEDEDDEAVKEEGWEPDPEEKALLREEFITQMHQRFLDGKDKDFNYSEVDDNPEYDNLDIVSRDAEEKYFDNDDEEDEEEEEEEEDEEEEEEEKDNKDEEEEEKMTE